MTINLCEEIWRFLIYYELYLITPFQTIKWGAILLKIKHLKNETWIEKSFTRFFPRPLISKLQQEVLDSMISDKNWISNIYLNNFYFKVTPVFHLMDIFPFSCNQSSSKIISCLIRKINDKITIFLYIYVYIILHN